MWVKRSPDVTALLCSREVVVHVLQNLDLAGDLLSIFSCYTLIF